MEDNKKIQIATIFNLLNEGKLMIDYKDFHFLFEFLKFQSIPNKHWFDKASWKMVKHINNKVKKAIKIDIQNTKFVSFTCDEVILWIMQVE
jgi:hypothetical protein